MSYTIAGRVIKNEYLALGTIISSIAIAVGASAGGEKKSESPLTGKPLPIEKVDVGAGSSEEESFIRQFVAEAEKADKHH